MKVDLHVHSEYSWDSQVSIERYIKLAEEKGIGAIAITDHNDTQSHDKIRLLQKSTNVLLIPGQEINTSDGHLLIYGWISTVARDMSMKETVKFAKEFSKENNERVICIAAHPYDYLRSGKGNVVLRSDVDGIEIFNASALFGFVNYIAKWKTRKLNIIKLSNSDCHRGSEFALAYNIIKKSKSVNEVLENLVTAVKSGKRIGIYRKLNRFMRRKLGRMSD